MGLIGSVNELLVGGIHSLTDIMCATCHDIIGKTLNSRKSPEKDESRIDSSDADFSNRCGNAFMEKTFPGNLH
jgi:hypothetical protein